MNTPTPIVYAQDVGAARFLAPVIRRLLDGGTIDSARILIHPNAEATLAAHGIGGRPIGETPVHEPRWAAIFESMNASHVICTTSAVVLDRSNAALIAAAREAGVPCLAAMDHWKGYVRFAEGPHMAYVPDWLLCIDETVQGALAAKGIETEAVAVGHPALESMAPAPRSAGQRPSVLLVSQPRQCGSDYTGIFMLDAGGGRRVIDLLVEALGDDVDFRLRRHPKETLRPDLPAAVRLDDSLDWDGAARAYDVYVGLDSMALVEAAMAGGRCISLAVPEITGLGDGRIPFEFSRVVERIDDLPRAIADVLAGEGPRFDDNPFAGSTERALAAVRRFLATTGQP